MKRADMTPPALLCWYACVIRQTKLRGANLRPVMPSWFSDTAGAAACGRPTARMSANWSGSAWPRAIGNQVVDKNPDVSGNRTLNDKKDVVFVIGTIIFVFHEFP